MVALGVESASKPPPPALLPSASSGLDPTGLVRSETLRQEYLRRRQVSAAGTAEGKGGADAAEGEGERPIRAALWRGLLRALPLALALQFFLVTSTSTRILRTFNCIEFPTEDAVLPGEQEPYRAYLADDLSLDCSTPEYATAQRWAYVLLFVWPIGVPLLYLGLLLASRRSIVTHRPSPLSRATDFLWKEYEERAFYWEPLDLVRKLTLTGFVLINTQGSKQLRVIIALLVSMLFLTLQYVLSPYKRTLDGRLAMFAHIGLVLVYLATLTINSCSLLETDTQTCGDEFGLSQLGLSYMFLSFSTALLGVGLLLVAWLVYTAASRVPTLRLVANAMEPLLTLRPQHEWHVHVSHIWSSGQDQAANIKRNLQLMLPGCLVFLDVDDLRDATRLEDYVDQSAALLLFLSRGFFKSRNCLREVRRAAATSKPLILVHEENLNKGGLPLEASVQECPVELRGYVFGAAAGGAGEDAPATSPPRTPITWHRYTDFQRLSLKLIAEQILLASPEFCELPSVPLYLPGEI